DFMTAAGGKFPVGTTFPNHVLMGFRADKFQDGKYGALRVTEVTPDKPAARAGLQVGDVIKKVAGRRFKTDEEYLDATAKAARSSTYEVAIEREGKPQTLVLEREFRPPFDEEVVAKQKSASQVPTSIADELSKLAKL